MALEWGWAWPANRRILYNRASADPDGKPWSERKKLVWWDEAQGKWTGEDMPDFDEEKRPDYVPADDATGPEAIARRPPLHHAVRRPRLALRRRRASMDGPLPTHYEPQESPFGNRALQPARKPGARRSTKSPRTRTTRSAREPTLSRSSSTTYRLTEHHTAGGMSRSVPYLSELQPQMFVEVHPELARERGLEHGGWATIVDGALGDRGARAWSPTAMRPLQIDGQAVTPGRAAVPLGLSAGLTTGGAANDLTHLALDPNVHIQEVKALTCDIRPGGVRAARAADASSSARPAREGEAARELERCRAQETYGDERRSRAWASSPTRRCASAARRARSRARSGTSFPRTGSSWTGQSYDNTGELGAEHVAARRVHRAAQAAAPGLDRRRATGRRARPERRDRDRGSEPSRCAG